MYRWFLSVLFVLFVSGCMEPQYVVVEHPGYVWYGSYWGPPGYYHYHPYYPHPYRGYRRR